MLGSKPSWNWWSEEDATDTGIIFISYIWPLVLSFALIVYTGILIHRMGRYVATKSNKSEVDLAPAKIHKIDK